MYQPIYGALFSQVNLKDNRNSSNHSLKGLDAMEKKRKLLLWKRQTSGKKTQFLRQESFSVSNALNQIKPAFNEQKRYVRRNCLEIRGVLTSSREDSKEIVKNIGSIVDVFLKDKNTSEHIPIESKKTMRFLP